jgi:hypothetical protein
LDTGLRKGPSAFKPQFQVFIFVPTRHPEEENPYRWKIYPLAFGGKLNGHITSNSRKELEGLKVYF